MNFEFSSKSWFGGVSRLVLALFLVMVAATGCTTVGVGFPEDQKNVPAEKGVILFSTSADKTNVSLGTRLQLVEGQGFNKYDKVIVQMDYPSASNFPEVHGHVRTLTLSPGDYYFVAASTNPFFIVSESPIYKFTVVAGQFSYLGNIHLSQNMLKSSQDYYGRDVDYFKSKNKYMSNVELIRAPLKTGPRFSDFIVKGTIWDAPR